MYIYKYIYICIYIYIYIYCTAAGTTNKYIRDFSFLLSIEKIK